MGRYCENGELTVIDNCAAASEDLKDSLCRKVCKVLPVSVAATLAEKIKELNCL